MNAALISPLARAAFIHLAHPPGLYNIYLWVGMMFEYRTGELLAKAAFLYHDDKRHGVLKHYAAIKGLKKSL